MKTPRQASRVFNLDGQSPPRLKNLFVVRFRRASKPPSDWEKNLCFILRSVDRPSITAEQQELSQYGKKRIIYTGWKGQPVKLAFYDTADSMALKMWAEYSAYYFSEFAQDSDAQFRSDVVTEKLLGDGFGYRPRPDNEEDGINSQFFFNAVEVIQVFGGYFVQFDLINPKIISFDGDELNYETSEPSMINMSMQYEGVLYRNGGAPIPIIEDSGLAGIFRDKFGGQTLEVSGPRRVGGYGSPNPGGRAGTGSAIGSAIGTILTGGAIAAFKQTDGFTTGNALGVFGKYAFGAGNNAINSATGVNIASLSKIRSIGGLFRR